MEQLRPLDIFSKYASLTNYSRKFGGTKFPAKNVAQKVGAAFFICSLTIFDIFLQIPVYSQFFFKKFFIASAVPYSSVPLVQRFSTVPQCTSNATFFNVPLKCFL